jgi:hypothetical protein
MIADPTEGVPYAEQAHDATINTPSDAGVRYKCTHALM